MDSIEGLKFQEVLELYEGRTAVQQKQHLEKELLPIKDRDVFDGKVLESMKNAVQAYKSIATPSEDSPTVLKQGHGWKNEIKFVPVSFEILDSDIPLTLVTIKRFRRDLSDPSGMIDEFFEVALLRGNFNVDRFQEVVDRLENDEYEESDPDIVAHMMMFDRGKDFHLMHRVVNPRFRSQGFGRLMFDGVKEFAKGCANAQNKNQDIFLEASQLDLIYRLFEYGYVPANEEEEKKLDKILTGDQELCVGEKYMIFPNTVSEGNRVHRNMGEAFMVKFVSKIEPGIIDDGSVQGIQRQTRQAMN